MGKRPKVRRTRWVLVVALGGEEAKGEVLLGVLVVGSGGLVALRYGLLRYRFTAEEHSARRAVAYYDEVIRLDPLNADAFDNRGVARAKSGDFEAAIAHYDHAIRLNPGHDLAIANRRKMLHLQRPRWLDTSIGST